MNQDISLFTIWRQEKLAKYHHTDDGYIYSLRAIIKNDQWQILLMYDERYKTYTVPWGKWEKWDDSLLESLKREVKEEIWCHVVDAQFVGQSKCFWSGSATCHVYYDVIIDGEPKLFEDHMASLHWCSYRETDDYIGYDILIDNQRQYIADDILRMRDLYDLVEYRYVVMHPQNDSNRTVLLPSVSSIRDDDIYLSIADGGTLSLVHEKDRDGQWSLIFAQKWESLLTGIKKVYQNF